MKQRFPYKNKIGIAIAVLVFGVVLIGFVGSAFELAKKVQFDAPVPGGWKMINESGKIASICLGSWSECGSITRNYRTGQSPRSSLEELRLTANKQGWILKEDKNTDNVITASLIDDQENWGRIVYVQLNETNARMTYEKK